MSVRGSKRASSRGEEGVRKRRRADPEEWQPRPLSDLKISTIYNCSAPEAPAELFRKDLISAMKLPDSEPLALDEYWVITDPWKQEWERGVQVPVNPDSLPEPTVTEIKQNLSFARNEFKLPKQKYVRLSRDAHFSSSDHYLSSASARAEAACAYDLDACDAAWLRALNGERARAGSQSIREDQLERVIEELEVRCWDKIQAIMKSEEGLGIEYDENVICDVCRSPDSEEGNEMVFCDSCNICVHQACYGITAIPSGQWLCRPCGDGVRPVCVLCPNLGGAMKCTPSGHKWAHVSCVLWIPEVSIGCAEKMEPITKISAIPASRWSLICVLCRERTGACIQCSVRTCKTAYHVTCAFKHGLEMRAIIEDENADDGVKLRSYCQKHSVSSKKDKCNGSGSEEDDSKRKRRKDMTSEEKSQARALRLHEIEAEFDKHVSIKDISTHLLDVDQDGIQYIYNYWKLKRRAGHNRPLLPPKADETDMLTHRQEQADLDKMKMFVQLRQDLERVRNLCYMVSRREKLSRSFFRMREQTFHKQVAVLSEENALAPAAMTAVIEANHGPSIYDRLYSHPDAVDHSGDFEILLAQIAGVDSADEKKKDLNGLLKNSKASENPYKRLYLNGSARRSASLYSGLSSGAESIPDRDTKYRRPIYSTTDDEDKNSLQAPKKKLFSKDKENNDNTKIIEKKKSRPSVASHSKMDSSSEDEIKNTKKREWPKSRTLRQMEREMGARPLSGTESDELMPMRSTKKLKLSADIYSDSENSDNKHEDVNEDKSSNATSDSQQHPFRTKAAVKEFIPLQKGENKGDKNIKRTKKSGSKDKGPESDEDLKDKENVKSSKNKDYPSDLIVPQRQAAKKASENMRSNTVNVKSREQNENIVESKPPQPTTEDPKPKIKTKLKDKRDNKESVKDKKDRKSSVSGNDVFEFEKEGERDALDILAYVPQRQAAKKAAEHIKSGMTKLPGMDNTPEETGKKKETDLSKKLSPRKDEEKRPRSPNKSSSGSTNNTSSSSSCSSSTSSEDEEDVGKIDSKGSADKRCMVKSLFSPPRRMNDDLPFLDKGTKVTSSSSPSSDSEAHKGASKVPSNTSSSKCPEKKSGSPSPAESGVKPGSGVPRKAPDKKLKTSDGQPERGLHSPSAEGEKPPRASHPLPRPSVRARTRSVTAGTRNLPHTGLGKPEKAPSHSSSSTQHQDAKEDSQSSQLPFTQWKKDKKMKPAARETTSTPQTSKDREDVDIDKVSNKHEDDKNEQAKYTDEVSLTPKVSKDKDVKKLKKSVSPLSQSPSQVPKPAVHESSPRNSQKVSQKTSNSVIEHTKDGHLEIDNFSIVQVLDSENTEKEPVVTNDKIPSHVVKSPKTPIETEHKMPEPSEGQTPKSPAETQSNNLKIPALESEKISTFEIVPPEFTELQEVEQNKSFIKTPLLPPAYPNRSIFSPQPTGKDTGCSEFFDFGNEILAVDETVNDDGFNISQGNEEIMKATPLTSFFGSDFLFKEDSKEDRGVRETLNLVEKLRMQMSSKKSNPCNQNESSDQEVNDVKDSEITLPSFIENEAFPKSQVLDEPKLLIENNLTVNSVEKHHTDIASTVRPCPIVDSSETNYDESNTRPDDVKNIEKCKSIITEDEKVWPVNDNHFNNSSTNNLEIEKQMQFNIHSIESGEMLHNPPVLQTELPENTHEVELAAKQSFLQSRDDKSFESNMETDSNIAMEPLHVSTSQSSETNISIQPESHRAHYERDLGTLPECTPIPSPYNSMRHQSKWAESELIPVRRSSSSSSSSDSSVSLNKHDNEHSDIHENLHKHSELLQNMGYSYHPCSMESHPYNPFSSEASQFVGGPVSLFPSTTIGSQLPLSSPGAALFPPNINLSYPNSTSMLSQLPKSSEESMSFSTPCTAAFTSSSHNMALTTAMIAPPTPKTVSENSSTHDGEVELTPPNSFSMQESPLRSTEEFSNNTLLQNQMINEKHITDNDSSPVQGKKSPMKATRMSSRFISQQSKSPGKSPGKSPRQIDLVSKGNGNRRGVSKSSRGSRSRGRPRGKGSQHMHNYDMDYHTIHNKLAGTVYDLDFDEDITNDSMNDLKSMRERRRSTDIHERKPDNAYRDSSQSPKFASPSQQALKRPSYSADIRDLRPPTPISELPTPVETPKSPTITINAPPEAPQQAFTKMVQPVLPGPVDMRTYSAFEASITDAFNNLLGAFASGTADQQLADIDEEMEKELHSALIASSNKSQEPLIPPPKIYYTELKEYISETPPQQGQDLTTPKVSLTDSRNQLKVKIKGPFLDANYSTSSVAPVIQQPSIPIMEPPSGIPILGAPSAVGSVTSAMISGTSNLRRMRKKELLRQYCTQDMNMDDPMTGIVVNQITPPAPVPSFNRTVITIPKAVASMTSIPTREDYKAVVDANMEKKRRKVSGSLVRDLRTSDNEVDAQDIRNASGLSIPTQLAISYKRRGRISKPSPTITSPNNISPAPKLKIKIGNFHTSDQSINPIDPNYIVQFKPPKKRHTSIPKPSVEDLRRESMKFRRKVFADFEEGKKDKKKRLKSEKRKKKRDKRSSEMHVVNKQSENATKLIIRIARRKDTLGTSSTKNESEEEVTLGVDTAQVVTDPFVYDPTAPDPLALDSPANTASPVPGSSKVSPIRLKLARGAGGSGYVMKDSPSHQQVNPSDTSKADALSAPLSNNNKHCEVR